MAARIKTRARKSEWKIQYNAVFNIIYREILELSREINFSVIQDGAVIKERASERNPGYLSFVFALNC